MLVVEKSRLVRYLSFIFFTIFIFTFKVGHAESQNNWDEYYQSILYDPPENFIVSGVQKIPGAGNGKIAIDLGSGVGHETKYLLQKGYKVIAVDGNAHALKYMLLQPGISQYQPNLTRINSTFERLDFSKLPQSDLVISSFSLPFVGKKDFNRIWQKVTATIKPGGHIIINLFDSGFAFFNNKHHMTFHTKKEAMALFTHFKIIEFREMRNDPLKPGAKNHYYVIVAKKL